MEIADRLPDRWSVFLCGDRYDATGFGNIKKAPGGRAGDAPGSRQNLQKAHLFDTFSGFDKRDLEEESAKLNRILSDTLFDNGSVEESLGTIGYRANCIVKKGYFPETITEDVRLESFAFVSLDMDLYRPILEGLNFFGDRLSPGGSIFVDDFSSEDFPGAIQAVVEFCEKNQVAYVNVSLGGRGKSLAVISKPLG